MYQQKINRIWVAIGVLLFGAGMAVSAMWDLEIDIFLHSPESVPAILMECFGFYPLYLPTILWVVCVAANPLHKLWQRVAAGLVGLAGTGFLVWYGQHGLLKRSLAYATRYSVVIWGLLLAGVVGLLLAKLPLARLEFVFGWGTAFMLLNNIVTNLLKVVWARTRFDDMMATGGFESFTSWLHPFGNGGSSFPSGHTAAACGIFILVLLCDVFPQWGKRRVWVWAVCWAYIAGMAVSRIVIGRHFLSDTLMAAFSMTLVFLLMTKTKWYQRSLQALYDAEHRNVRILAAEENSGAE